VTAIARGDNKTDAKNFLRKDLFELTKEDLVGFDVVVDAFGVFKDELLDLHSKATAYLSDLLAGTDIRLLIVGGAGSLYLDDKLTTQLLEK
ncbi:hypothetical protein IR145_01385, partial [Streptococcus danieliae]|nr:hypothetical protein [Streptococcus danieliae]